MRAKQEHLKYFQIDPRNLSELCGPPMLSTFLPRRYLYPIQGPDEFKRESIQKILLAYDEMGSKLFDNYPLACFAFPVTPNSQDLSFPYDVPCVIGIQDGHHRLKLGDDLSKSQYNVQIYSVEQARRFLFNKKPFINLRETYATLSRWLAEASGVINYSGFYKVIFRNSGNQINIELT